MKYFQLYLSGREQAERILTHLIMLVSRYYKRSTFKKARFPPAATGIPEINTKTVINTQQSYGRKKGQLKSSKRGIFK